MNKAETTFIKLSQEMVEEPVAKKRKYPISRALMGIQDVGTLGIHNFISQRALQGRINTGAKPVSKSEEILMKAIKKSQEKTAQEKTYPISRFLTSPEASGVSGGIAGGVAGSVLKGGKGVLLGVPLGAAASYFGQRALRDIDARSELGKAHKGRKGFGSRKKKQLQAVRDNYTPTFENQAKQDKDTAINAGAAIVTGAGRRAFLM